MADLIADIFKVGLLTFLKIFQCNSGSEFEAEVTKLLENHEVTITRTTTTYKHTYTALNKILVEQLFKVQDVQELNDPEKVSSTWAMYLYGLVYKLNDTKPQMIGKKPKDDIKLKKFLC